MAIDLDMATQEELNQENVWEEGYDFMQATPETIVSKLKVAARCSPEAKLKIVQDMLHLPLHLFRICCVTSIYDLRRL